MINIFLLLVNRIVEPAEAEHKMLNKNQIEMIKSLDQVQKHLYNLLSYQQTTRNLHCTSLSLFRSRYRLIVIRLGKDFDSKRREVVMMFSSIATLLWQRQQIISGNRYS